MSLLERAYVNCMRCYKLANSYNILDEEDELRRNNDDSLWATRNEAMRALEKMEHTYGLTACATCDYSEPRIANAVKEDVEILED